MAIVTLFGLIEFLRVPFGLKNAAQAFQRVMDPILSGLDCVFVYLDGTLIASSNSRQHAKDLEQLFGLLDSHGLIINRDKCQFGVDSIDFKHSNSRTGKSD